MLTKSEDCRTYKEVWFKKWLAIYHSALSIYSAIGRQARESCPQKTLYVVFRKGVRVPWQRFLDPNFTHVFMLHDIIHQDVGQGVMQLEFTSNRINAIHLPLASLESYIDDLKEHGCKVLKVKPFKNQSVLGSCLPKFIPYNCVSLTKQALGIRAFGMITPKRLYLYLLKYKNVERL